MIPISELRVSTFKIRARARARARKKDNSGTGTGTVLHREATLEEGWGR